MAKLKRSEEEVEKLFKRLYIRLTRDKSILFYGTLFNEETLDKTYSSELRHKFKNNKIISEYYKRTKGLLESRIVENAARGKINPVFAMFNLKNNYNWQDKREIKQQNDGKMEIVINKK